MHTLLKTVQNLMKTDLVKFGIVGVLSTAIDFLLLNLFISFGLTIYWAIGFAYLVGALNGYLLNNYWTYRRLQQKGTFLGYAKYAAVSFIGLGLTEVIVYGLTTTLHTGVNLNKLVAVVVVFAWNFLANRLFTFKVAEPLTAL